MNNVLDKGYLNSGGCHVCYVTARAYICAPGKLAYFTGVWDTEHTGVWNRFQMPKLKQYVCFQKIRILVNYSEQSSMGT